MIVNLASTGSRPEPDPLAHSEEYYYLEALRELREEVCRYLREREGNTSVVFLADRRATHARRLCKRDEGRQEDQRNPL